MRKGRAIIYVLLVVSVVMIAYGGIKMYRNNAFYREANASYEALRTQTKVTSEEKPVETPRVTPDLTGTTRILTRQFEAPECPVDFNALQEINSDLFAWVLCPGSKIDYPVAAAKDYEYYLNHLPDGTKNANGTLFLDYNNKKDFSSRLSIIYGHNMLDRQMFGTLCFYKDYSYYDIHPTWYIYTRDMTYKVDLLYGFVIKETAWHGEDMVKDAAIDELLAYAREHTTFTSIAQEVDGLNYVAFSTCSYEFNNARFVVLGQLAPEYA